jgi:hypothetical protein
MSTKDSNPKDGFGALKTPLHLVSGVMKAYASVAHFLGMVKYGAWNWRVAGARASVYRAALDRHVDRWWEGEEMDRDGTPHLANALACLNILIECSVAGKLIDDRPPALPLDQVHADIEAMMKVVVEKYGHMTPHHYKATDVHPGEHIHSESSPPPPRTW